MTKTTLDFIAEIATEVLADRRPELRTKAKLEMTAPEARVMTNALDDVLIPALLSLQVEAQKDHGPNSDEAKTILYILNTMCRLSMRLRDDIKELMQGLTDALNDKRAEEEDAEIAEIKRQQRRAASAPE